MSIQHYRLCGCYILLSENECAPKGKSYIGFTVDPGRRIRQHNGDLTRGGAGKTKALRPWRMICIVHGFRSKVQGLQFEWGWQHPLLFRSVRTAVMEAHIPGVKLTTKGRHRESRIGPNMKVLQAMLSSPPWCQIPLTVTFFDMSYMKEFSLDPSSSTRLDLSDDVQSFSDQHLSPKDHTFLLDYLNTSSCRLCQASFSHREGRIVSCPSCSRMLHASCASLAFFPHAGHLIPQGPGRCTCCSSCVTWPDLIRSGFIYSKTRITSDDSETDSSSSSSCSSSSAGEEHSEKPIDPPGDGLRYRMFNRTNNSNVFQI